jgi:uncharacterized delta-60 repeat protein
VAVNGVTVASGSTSVPLALHLGANVLTITVTSLDGQVQQTYTVTVTRAVPMAGNMDLSFNGTGQLTTDISTIDDYANAVAVQSDGRIVVAGSAYSNEGNNFAVARYNPDGTPDTTFGAAGKVITDLTGGPDQAFGLALQGDGKIVVAGSAYNGVIGDFALVRYNANGSLDTTFNGTGKVTTPMGDSATAGITGVAVQADGKIVVAGYALSDGTYKFALARYHGNASTGAPGTLDATFNGTGKVLTAIGTVGDFISSLALQGDGKIVVGGQSHNGVTNDFAVARYETNGALDTTFNGTGSVVTGIGASDDTLTSVAVQGDGKIVAAGFAWNGSKNDFALARYTSAGVLDTDFNGTGKIITSATTGENAIT